MAKRLLDKTALITGGARGIGAATTKLFLKHGAKVMIADIQDDDAQALIEEFGPNNDQVSFIHCDVSNETDVKNAVDNVVAKHGKLDIMFANAGIGGKHTTSILEDTYDNLKNIFDVNVFGPFFCGKHAARVMIPANQGSIIFSASLGAVSFGNAPHPYVSSKAAVIGLCKNLGVELGRYGIRVNCISPYAVSAPRSAKRHVLGEVRERAGNFILQAANLKGVVLEEEDVANAALYLAGDEGKYVSGLNLALDGGYSTTNVALSNAFKKS